MCGGGGELGGCNEEQRGHRRASRSGLQRIEDGLDWAIGRLRIGRGVVEITKWVFWANQPSPGRAGAAFERGTALYSRLCTELTETNPWDCIAG